MGPKVVTVTGIVIEGHRVASGPSRYYPYASLERQKPLFKARGLDLDRFYSGTINVSIAPLTFEMVNPEFTFRQVAWTDLHPPEDFSFSHCRVRFGGGEYEGFVYYPHPETKQRNFQSPSLLEILTITIPGIRYGETVAIELRGDEILVNNQA